MQNRTVSNQETSVTGVLRPAGLADAAPVTAPYSSWVTGVGASQKSATSIGQVTWEPSSRRTISPPGTISRSSSVGTGAVDHDSSRASAQSSAR